MSDEVDVGDVAAALQLSIGLCLRQLRQISDDGALTLPQVSVLKRLVSDGSVSVTDLAKAEQISVQSVGATLRSLEIRGLVDRGSDPDDGRRVLLSITTAGRRVLADKRNARAEQLAIALSEGFSQMELQQLMQAAPLIERLAQRL